MPILEKMLRFVECWAKRQSKYKASLVKLHEYITSPDIHKKIISPLQLNACIQMLKHPANTVVTAPMINSFYDKCVFKVLHVYTIK